MNGYGELPKYNYLYPPNDDVCSLCGYGYESDVYGLFGYDSSGSGSDYYDDSFDYSYDDDAAFDEYDIHLV
ncbi:hypothetical protein PTKIN_Ptkin10aG0195500 [Pterospermum kingtungense]